MFTLFSLFTSVVSSQQVPSKRTYRRLEISSDHSQYLTQK